MNVQYKIIMILTFIGLNIIFGLILWGVEMSITEKNKKINIIIDEASCNELHEIKEKSETNLAIIHYEKIIDRLFECMNNNYNE